VPIQPFVQWLSEAHFLEANQVKHKATDLNFIPWFRMHDISQLYLQSIKIKNKAKYHPSQCGVQDVTFSFKWLKNKPTLQTTGGLVKNKSSSMSQYASYKEKPGKNLKLRQYD
jgi:hypothetical protein